MLTTPSNGLNILPDEGVAKIQRARCEPESRDSAAWICLSYSASAFARAVPLAPSVVRLLTDLPREERNPW